MGLDMYLMRVKNADEYFELEKKSNIFDKETDKIWEKYVETFKKYFEDDCEIFFKKIKENHNIDFYSNEKDTFKRFIQKLAEIYRSYYIDKDIKLEDLKWYLFNYFSCIDVNSKEEEEKIAKDIMKFIKQLPLKENLEYLIKILKKKNKEYNKIEEEQKTLILDDEAIYWRKANQIYDFFISLDKKALDCEPIKVTSDDLKTLKEKCEKALEAYENDDKDKILKILPPRPGFFFGATEIDDCYHNDLKYTKKKIEELLEKYLDAEYIFRASW